MLERRLTLSLIRTCWKNVPCAVNLAPDQEQAFIDQFGPVPTSSTSRRRFSRFYLRTRVLLWRENVLYGCFTKDVSRMGIAILSPIPLLPRERVCLRVPDGSELWLCVVRCRRITATCFECGATFIRQRGAADVKH